MAFYYNPTIVGLQDVIANNDGYSIDLRWAPAYPSRPNNKVGYHIYFSDDKELIFYEGPKFFVKDSITRVTIPQLTPGTLYQFAVRAVEYDVATVDLNSLVPYSPNLYLLPSTLLTSDIQFNSLSIPVLDAASLPNFGILKAGVELIRYGSVDSQNETLNSIVRGYNGTKISGHATDGYDGSVMWNPILNYFVGLEEMNPHVYQGQCRFDIDHYSFTATDGYKQMTKDLLTTDLSFSDASNENFPSYDYAGYHRTDPVLLLNGECVGSYIGGEMYCADGYNGVGVAIRGMSVQDQNNQRQEMLLSITAEPVVLLKQQRTGYRCSCFLPSSEHPDDRCVKCFGKGYVVSYEQYFNPRRSDGRIMVRFGPADESVKTTETGMESDMSFDCWTLTVPSIKNRDIVIRFDQEGNEEFRYEVMNVSRNKMLESLMGAQKFKLQRIRKTDTAYRIAAFRNTEKLPAKIFTGLASAPTIPPHSHTIVVNENTTTLQSINQLTGVTQGHNHVVRNGVVQEALGHTHTIIITNGD